MPSSGADERPDEHPGVAANALVVLSTAVTAGVGGLYMATRSIVVTALAAGLIAVLGACVTVQRRHRR